MKTIFAILALCLATTYAAVLPSYEDYFMELQDIIAQAKQLQNELLEQNYETAVSTQEAEALYQAIEDLGLKNPECATRSIEAIVADMFGNIEMCDASTYASAGEITKDVLIVTLKSLLHASNLAAQFKRCQSYENSGWKATCFTKFAVQVGQAINDLRVTIKDMVNNGKGRISAVYAAGQTCNQFAVDRTLQQLSEVRSSVDICVAGH